MHLSVFASRLNGGSLNPFPLFSHLDVYNKVDAISLEQVDKLARQDHTVVISAEQDLKWAPQHIPFPQANFNPTA